MIIININGMLWDGFLPKESTGQKSLQRDTELVNITLHYLLFFFFFKQKQSLSIWTNKVVFPKDILRVDILALVYIGHSEVLCSLGRLLNEEFNQKREIQLESNQVLKSKK